jgi:hypothetical protein
MVQIQDVYRFLLGPVERKFKIWETGTGFKAKVGRWLRIGKAPVGVFESWAKAFNTWYMMLYMLTQRPVGPLYKRLFEFDMQPTKGLYLFARHRYILLFWLGNTFMEDVNAIKVYSKNSDYLQFYMDKYKRFFPHNSLNWRTSAHYIEISRIYTTEMTKKFLTLERKMLDEHHRKRAFVSL